MSEPRLAVLVSGNEELLVAILAAKLPVRLVLSDRMINNRIAPHGITIARLADPPIPTAILNRSDWWADEVLQRDDYSRAVCVRLQESGITHVCLAGWKTVLGPSVFEAYAGRVINFHPSIPGQHETTEAIRAALEAGDTEIGYTIHLAEVEPYSSRYVLRTQSFPIHPTDNVVSLRRLIRDAAARDLVEVLHEQIELYT